MKQVLVSVIVPVYQSEDTLSACIESVLAQGYSHFELCLIDDGSTDRSASILADYQRRDERIRVFSKPNGGASSARNAALRQIRGEYLAFLDSDDQWDPRMLSRMVDVAEQANADVVQCHFRYVYGEGLSRVPKPPFRNGSVFDRKDFPRTVYRKLIFGAQINHVCNMLYRTDLTRGFRMNEDVRTAEDLMYNIQVLTKASRFAYITDALYVYNQKSTGLTGSSVAASEKLRCNLCASRMILQYLPAWGMDTPFWRLCARLRPAFITALKLGRIARSLPVRLLTWQMSRRRQKGVADNDCGKEILQK